MSVEKDENRSVQKDTVRFRTIVGTDGGEYRRHVKELLIVSGLTIFFRSFDVKFERKQNQLNIERHTAS